MIKSRAAVGRKIKAALSVMAATAAAGVLAFGNPAALSAGADTKTEKKETFTSFGGEVEGGIKGFAIGPGYDGLPFEELYGDYQWALNNTGVFKLVPNHKASVEETFQGWLGGQKPKSEEDGPQKEAEGTTLAVEGIDINILPAWEKYAQKQDKRQAVVALIDTGVDFVHEDLFSSIWENEDEFPGDGIDNDGNGYIDDVYGWNFYNNNNRIFSGAEDNHGTHSAGTIAAERNGMGIAGISDPQYVKIMVIKVLGTTNGIGSTENVIKAIRYAQENGASICNLSFGTSRYSEELYETMKNSNMLFVVAAGNGDRGGNGYSIDQYPVYPASFNLDNVITVANIRFNGKLDPASNFGARSVDLAAPGSYILSTVAWNKYSYMSGTSMAAPMVTGVAAMMYSYDQSVQLGDLKDKILASVRIMPSLNGMIAAGGMLDASAALDSVATE